MNGPPTKPPGPDDIAEVTLPSNRLKRHEVWVPASQSTAKAFAEVLAENARLRVFKATVKAIIGVLLLIALGLWVLMEVS